MSHCSARTDHIDLIQFHENIRFDDPDRFFAAGGALEAVEAAKKAGKIRYIGFTGHKDPLVHERMLEVAKQHNFHFDSVPDAAQSDGRAFPQLCSQRGAEACQPGHRRSWHEADGRGFILESNTVTPVECLHYALNLPTSVVITGCDSMKILDQAFEAARTFKPMTEPEANAQSCRNRATPRMQGKYEQFKISTRFDGTIKNPQWMG